MGLSDKNAYSPNEFSLLWWFLSPIQSSPERGLFVHTHPPWIKHFSKIFLAMSKKNSYFEDAKTLNTWPLHMSYLQGYLLSSLRNQVVQRVADSLQGSQQRSPCRGRTFPQPDCSTLSRLTRVQSLGLTQWKEIFQSSRIKLVFNTPVLWSRQQKCNQQLICWHQIKNL